MKKNILLILLFASSCFAQMHTVFPGGAIGGYEPEAQAYFNRMTNPPSADTLAFYNTFIKGLKDSSLWAEFDECGIPAINNQINALLGVKGLGDVTAVNSPTFTAYQGFTADLTPKYINTGINLSTDVTQFTQDDGSMGVYIRTNVQGTQYDIGITNTKIATRWTDDKFYSAVNTTTLSSVANTNSQGFFAANRSASNAVQMYKNGIQVTTGATTSTTISSLDLFIGCWNSAGSPSQPSTRQYSFWYVGGSLTATQHRALNNLVEQLMDNLGVGVQ